MNGWDWLHLATVVLVLAAAVVLVMQMHHLRGAVVPPPPSDSGYSQGFVDGYASGRKRLAQECLEHLDENGNVLPRSMQLVELDDYRRSHRGGDAS